MPIVYRDGITRSELKSNPATFYVFGDNIQRMGHGRDAEEMRGEPNAIGIPTKRYPTMSAAAFFSDNSANDMLNMMIGINLVQQLLDQDKTVVAPLGGLGLEMSELPARAPRTYLALYDWFSRFSDRYGAEPCPWQPPPS